MNKFDRRYRRLGLVSDSAGATVVEFAFGGMVLLISLILGFELLRFCYHTIVVQHVAVRTLRFAVVSPGATVATIENKAIGLARELGPIIDGSQVKVCRTVVSTLGPPPAAVSTSCIVENRGNPGDFMTVNISYPVTLFLPGPFSPTYQVQGLAVGKNEP